MHTNKHFQLHRFQNTETIMCHFHYNLPIELKLGIALSTKDTYYIGNPWRLVDWAALVK